MDFYFETVNKHCNFLPQILFPLPLADYKQNKMKENYNLPPNHIGYKTDTKSATDCSELTALQDVRRLSLTLGRPCKGKSASAN